MARTLRRSASTVSREPCAHLIGWCCTSYLRPPCQRSKYLQTATQIWSRVQSGVFFCRKSRASRTSRTSQIWRCRFLPEIVSEEPLNDDWRRRFFLYAQDVSDADMQAIWGHVLAGEITAPRSYALKTWDVLRSLGSAEAEVFRKLSRLVFWGGNVIPPGHGPNRGLEEFGIRHFDLMQLRDYGLVHEGDSLRLTYPDEVPVTLYYQDRLLRLSAVRAISREQAASRPDG